MINVPKPVRIVLAVIGLAIVLLYASAAVGRYRENRPAESPEATSTVTPSTPAGAGTQKPSAGTASEGEGASAGEDDSTTNAKNKPAGPVVLVKVDGLNFRREPDKDATVIRGLDAGERLSLLKREGGWFYAEDSSGEKGWLYGSDQYSTVEE